MTDLLMRGYVVMLMLLSFVTMQGGISIRDLNTEESFNWASSASLGARGAWLQQLCSVHCRAALSPMACLLRAVLAQ